MSQALMPPAANNNTTATAIIGVARPLVARPAERAGRDCPVRTGSAGAAASARPISSKSKSGWPAGIAGGNGLDRAAAGATAAGPAAGTSTGALHFGHGTRRPAKFSGADNFCPQLPHVTVMFMFHLGRCDELKSVKGAKLQLWVCLSCPPPWVAIVAVTES